MYSIIDACRQGLAQQAQQDSGEERAAGKCKWVVESCDDDGQSRRLGRWNRAREAFQSPLASLAFLSLHSFNDQSFSSITVPKEGERFDSDDCLSYLSLSLSLSFWL